MKIVVRLPLNHDKIGPVSFGIRGGLIRFIALIVLVAGGFAMIERAYPSQRGKPTKQAVYAWMSAVCLGAVAIAFLPNVFGSKSPLGWRKVILDDNGVRHPHYNNVVPWRDITAASLSTAFKSVKGPEVAMLNLALIDDPLRYPHSYNPHATTEEESHFPPTIRFPLEGARESAEEILAFVREKIATHRS